MNMVTLTMMLKLFRLLYGTGCAVVCEAQLVPVSSQLTETVGFNVNIKNYYVWDLSYSKHFQLLGFIEHFV